MTSSTTPKTILLRGDPLYGEARATAAITPGMLLATVGPVRTVGSQPTAAPAGAGAMAPVFARENETIGNGIAQAYAENENVLLMHCRAGDQVYAWLATGGNVAAGANLSAATGGVLSAATPGSQAGADPFAVTFPSPVIARALETLNNTSGAPARIKVEIV